MSNIEARKIPVAILGATGLVGQKAIALLERHPQFYVDEIAASDRRAGQTFGETVDWREMGAIPESVFGKKLKKTNEIESTYVISALPASAAKEIEPFLASKGAFVFSNASSFRMDPEVPILIPEINLDHLSLLEKQKTSGKIITNPNCAATFIALALGPLMNLSEIKEVSAVTMQAISGAGYPGIDSFDILGNIIPYIPNEEEKINRETVKILGDPAKVASFGMTTQVHRVPVLNGHTITLNIHFADQVDLQEVYDCYQSPGLYTLYHEKNRPQPNRDIDPYDQKAHIGQIKHGSRKNIVSLIVMGNNLVRGAAGASLRNLEAVVENWIESPV